MNKNSSHHRFSEDDPSLDELFKIRDMAGPDFASRTVKAVRAHQQRAAIYRFTAWAGAAAASVALFIALAIWPETGTSPEMAIPRDAPETTESTSAAQPAMSAHVTSPGEGEATAEELTALLHAALAEDDVMFYGHASELEALLEEAIALSDEENLETLDMLLLLAQN